MDPSSKVAILPAGLGHDVQRQLSEARHDVNNRLAGVIAAAEILFHKPEMVGKLAPRMLEDATEIHRRLETLYASLEQTLQLPSRSDVRSPLPNEEATAKPPV